MIETKPWFIGIPDDIRITEAVFKILLLFHYINTSWVVGIPLLDHYNPQYTWYNPPTNHQPAGV